jgi:hypothetical protein
MFESLSIAIKNLLIKEIKDIEVKFGRPDDKFANTGATPIIVNMFLYDVREDVALRSNELSFERSNGVVTVEGAPFYVTCSYVMTVWAHEDDEAPLNEQKLLGELMQLMAGQTQIEVPATSSPVPLRIAAIDEIGSLSEFWTSLGNNIRPSFVLKATVALESPIKKEKPFAATSLRVKVGPYDGPIDGSDSQAAQYVIGGKVTYEPADEKGNPATVEVLLRFKTKESSEELSWKTSPDENGFYAFCNVPGSGATPYTLMAKRTVNDEAAHRLQETSITKSVYVPRTKGHLDDYDLTF